MSSSRISPDVTDSSQTEFNDLSYELASKLDVSDLTIQDSFTHFLQNLSSTSEVGYSFEVVSDLSTKVRPIALH
jgi:hypothetical protein